MHIIKVRTKILCLLFGTILVLGILLIALVQPVLKQKLREELAEKGEFMAEHLAITITDYLLTEQFLQLQIKLREFPLEDNDTIYIIVKDKNNQVVAHTFENGFPAGLKIIDQLIQGDHNHQTEINLSGTAVLDTTKPILAGRLGHIHVGLSETIISQSTAKVLWLILAIIGAVLFLGSLIAALFAKKLTVPLIDLARVTKAVGQGDLSQRVSAVSNDELGQLSLALNQMIDDLQQTTVSKEDYRNQTEFLHQVVESIPYPFFVINVDDYSVSLANSATGISSETTNITCHALTHKRDAPCWQNGSCECPLQKVRESRQPVVVEHLHFDKNKQPQYVEVHGYPIFDSEQKFIQMIELSIDITDRKMAINALHNSQEDLQRKNLELEKAYQELQSTHAQMIQQEKMASIGQLAAGVAHEINNPMGFISSNLATLSKYGTKVSNFIEALLQTVEECQLEQKSRQALEQQKKTFKIDYILEDLKDLVEESLDGANRVTEIVKNLKSFARPDDQGLKPADINECLENTLKIIWNEIKYKAEVSKDYGELPLTKCSPMELNQVFINILVNAAHAIEDHGEIRIKTWVDKQIIFVEISDSGCGIDEANLSKIFEPFFTTKEVGKGTGLGMSISYEIIKRHDGDIHVDSKIGEGTTFTIELPVVT